MKLSTLYMFYEVLCACSDQGVVWACSMEPVKLFIGVLGGGLRMPNGELLCTCPLILSPGVFRNILSHL